MVFKNIQGTTGSSFKIGVKGVELLSLAVTEGQDNIENYRVFAKDRFGEIHRLAYDIEIPTTNIQSYQDNGDGTWDFVIKEAIRNSDGSYTTITKTVTLISDISALNIMVGPDNTTIGNIVLWANDNGTETKDSGLSISSEIVETVVDPVNGNDIRNPSLVKEVPTSDAVVDYVGSLSEVLLDRLLGR